MTKSRKIQISLLGLFLAGLLFMGQSKQGDITVLYPEQLTDSTSYDQSKIFLLSALKDSTLTVTVSEQWTNTRFFDFRVPELHDNFAKEFIKLFDPSGTIQSISYSFKADNIISLPETLRYAFTDSMTIRSLWSTTPLSKFLKSVSKTNAQSVLVNVRGWKDSVYVSSYDDPTADGRALFKIQTHLIPGKNLVYFSPRGKRSDAIEYSSQLTIDQKALDSRDHRFHLSTLETACSTCHEGLPSADSGQTMKADCSVCHKALATAKFVHSPVEMKECTSCHTWSVEKKVMAGPTVPDKCFECHTEKKAEIDSAKVQHPVATDCTTCHSPHSTGQPHLLKTNVYDLCTTCHLNEKINHPVGRHPLRFAKISDNEEISCISCHNPHGSSEEHLLKVAGGAMAVCAKCHQ